MLNRMPRLAEWHAEAFAATLLDEPEVVHAFATLKQLGELQRLLPERLKSLEALDQRLDAVGADVGDQSATGA
jgi:hypothetical protein